MFRRKINQDKETRRCRGIMLERVVREGFSDKKTFDQEAEGSEGPDHLTIWNKCIPGRRNSKCWHQKAGYVWHVL